GRRRARAVVAPAGKEPSPEPHPRGPLEEPGGDDLVGVDVPLGEHHRAGGEGAEGLHQRLSCAGRSTSPRGSASAPAMAAAAAGRGLGRRVRAPAPCPPWKSRWGVRPAERPAATCPPSTPTHIEQPGSRHSAPASRNTWWSPSTSAARLTSREPGTTSV